MFYCFFFLWHSCGLYCGRKFRTDDPTRYSREGKVARRPFASVFQVVSPISDGNRLIEVEKNTSKNARTSDEEQGERKGEDEFEEERRMTAR